MGLMSEYQRLIDRLERLIAALERIPPPPAPDPNPQPVKLGSDLLSRQREWLERVKEVDLTGESEWRDYSPRTDGVRPGTLEDWQQARDKAARGSV